MNSTPAFERFLASLQLDHEKWHDGVGYDLRALKEVSRAERDRVVDLLTAREQTWREVEALGVIDSPAARDAVDAASTHHLSIDTRLAAAAVMHQQGRLPGVDLFLAREIRNLSRLSDGLTRALLMAQEHPTDAVKQALLWASCNCTDCAPHCAGALCHLAGLTDDPFDWNLRPMFLRLGRHNSQFERQAAFDELCALVKMQIDHSWS